MALEADQETIPTVVDPASGEEEPHPRRRLSLVWQPHVEEPGEFVPTGSSNARFRKVRRAMQQEQCVERRHTVRVAAESIRLLAPRVGRNPSQDPRQIRHQWSALNVPLMWSAAEGDINNPVVRWIVKRVHKRVPTVIVAGVQMSGHDAAATGWESLRDVLHSRGIRSREGLAEWIHSQGFAMPRWGAHFSARAQKRLLHFAIEDDARVSGLESFVRPGDVCGVLEAGVTSVAPGVTNNPDRANQGASE